MAATSESGSSQDYRVTVRTIGGQNRVTLPEWVRDAAVYDAFAFFPGDGEDWKVNWVGDTESERILVSNAVPESERFGKITDSNVSDKGSVRVPTAVQDVYTEFVEEETKEGVDLGFVAPPSMLHGDDRAAFCLHERQLAAFVGGPQHLDIDSDFPYNNP